MERVIYLITNLLNGKQYIGQTRRPVLRRFKEHCSLKEKGTVLNNAIKKYGIDNFKIEIVRKCNTDIELNFWETYFITPLISSRDFIFSFFINFSISSAIQENASILSLA